MNGLYCVDHKTDVMVDVVHIKCKQKGCKTRPSYNIEGLSPLYCAAHAKDDMVNVVSHTCTDPNCKTLATFGNEGDKVPTFCLAHKTPEMIDVRHTMCADPQCGKRPTFNLEGLTFAMYCSDHKEDIMVDVLNKTCAEPNCKLQPSFNKIGLIGGVYCSFHKKDGMVDVVTKRCAYESCERHPSFNNDGDTIGLYCSYHKAPDMVDVKHIKKQCKTALCTTRGIEKYEGYCLVCFMNLYPDRPVARNYKTKEFAVVDYIKNAFPDQNWIADKIINGGFSRRRPDLILHLKNHVIIIEVDENKHNTYECICENKRIMLISQDVEHKPIVMLRFNPDKYKTNKEVVKSCWELNKNGICVIAKSKKEEWAHRLKVLEEQVIYWMEHETTKTLEIIELFY